MSQILVRNLSPETVERLKERARDHKRSLEAEVRSILDAAAMRIVLRAGEKSAEFRKFEKDVTDGKSRNEAFRDYSDAVLAKRRFNPTDSADVIRAEREQRDARLD
jgi:plasmid stability protein